jgi:hypothetical protein
MMKLNKMLMNHGGHKWTHLINVHNYIMFKIRPLKALF